MSSEVDDAVGQHVGHFAVDDALGQTFGDGGLADTGLTDQERIVLAAAAGHLHQALELGRTADHWIDLAGLGLGIEVDREVLGAPRRFFLFGLAVANLGLVVVFGAPC